MDACFFGPEKLFVGYFPMLKPEAKDTTFQDGFNDLEQFLVRAESEVSSDRSLMLCCVGDWGTCFSQGQNLVHEGTHPLLAGPRSGSIKISASRWPTQTLPKSDLQGWQSDD